MFFGATAVVSELRDALNVIWKTPEDLTCSRTRVSAAGNYLNPVAAPPAALIQTADWVVTFIVITALFAFIFKVLPNVSLKWADVAIGAVLTSLLFTAGKALLTVYLDSASFMDSYGAASSLVILLVWVYYSAQVFFLGSEFTRAYACRHDPLLMTLSATTLD